MGARGQIRVSQNLIWKTHLEEALTSSYGKYFLVQRIDWFLIKIIHSNQTTIILYKDHYSNPKTFFLFLFFRFNGITQTSFEKHLLTEGSFPLFRNKFIIWITINWARRGYSTGGRWGVFRYSGWDLIDGIWMKLWRWVVRAWRRNVKCT